MGKAVLAFNREEGGMKEKGLWMQQEMVGTACDQSKILSFSGGLHVSLFKFELEALKEG